MIVKTPVLEIKSGAKGKFAIKIQPVLKPCEKKYVLFIQREKSDFENILLRITFLSELPLDQTDMTYSQFDSAKKD